VPSLRTGIGEGFGPHWAKDPSVDSSWIEESGTFEEFAFGFLKNSAATAINVGCS